MPGLGIGLGLGLGGSGGGASLIADKASYLASISAGALIASLSKPFGPNTTYTTVGTVPAQLALSGSTITAGAGANVVGTAYALKVRAASADGAREVAETLTFTALAAVVTLNALALLATTGTVGTAATVNITGASAGSTITGTPPDGMTLNSGARTISGTPTTTGTYSLVLTETLAGATNSPRSTTLTFTVSAASVPTNSVAPAITGTAQEGQVLSCSSGTWNGSPTYAYQWNRDGAAISGAINATRTLTSADVGHVMTCTVTATNSGGSASATSGPTATVIAATVAVPVNSVAPVVSGSTSQGSTLTTTPGTWSGSPTFAYQWRRAGVDIAGATATTYVLVAADAGQSITCRVLATNSGGTAGATSNAVAADAAAPSTKFNIVANSQYVPILAF